MDQGWGVITKKIFSGVRAKKVFVACHNQKRAGSFLTLPFGSSLRQRD
jgi:hypothetical protein